MTVTRKIATNLAQFLTSSDWVPVGVEAPIVALDGIAGQLDIGAHPLVVLTPRQAEGLHRAQPVHVVEILVGADPSSHLAGNPAASTPGPDGVLRYGVGDLLDNLVGILIGELRSANPGAVLASVSVEYNYDTTPIQYATITATYGETVAFGD